MNKKQRVKMEKEIATLKKQGLKEGVDFDVTTMEDGETTDDGLEKITSNKLIKEQLMEIGNIGKKKKNEKST